MDIEQLSKSQIVLLTLLVSFMTSIATGIVTVSLMEQAPPVIAQTVNRVIERTVETVAPAKTGQTAATVVTQEKTVIVKEQDLISQAIERITPSLVRVYTTQETKTFLGIGLVLDASGTVITDSSALGEQSEVHLTLADDTQVRAFVSRRDKDTGIAYLTAATSTEETPIQWKPVSIATGHAVLGDVIVAISGKTVSRIADGLVTSIPPASEDSAPMIDTNIATDSILDGSPIINTDGTVVGISTSVSRAANASRFIAASVLLAPPPASAKSE